MLREGGVPPPAGSERVGEGGCRCRLDPGGSWREGVTAGRISEGGGRRGASAGRIPEGGARAHGWSGGWGIVLRREEKVWRLGREGG